MQRREPALGPQLCRQHLVAVGQSDEELGQPDTLALADALDLPPIDQTDAAVLQDELLGGTVLDDKRALLKAQTAQFVLDQIAEIDRKARLAKRRG